MKRRKAEKHLRQCGCTIWREGAKHTIYINPENNKKSQLPRHSEVQKDTFLAMCKKLCISKPSSAA